MIIIDANMKNKHCFVFLLFLVLSCTIACTQQPYFEGGGDSVEVQSVIVDGYQYRLIPNTTNLFLPGCAKGQDAAITVKLNSDESFLLVLPENDSVIEFEITDSNNRSHSIIINVLYGSDDVASLLLSFNSGKGTIEEVESDSSHNTKAQGLFSLICNDTTVNANLPVSIKGRGNASWTRAKKSFQITLDKKTELLGMGKSKKWILLSNTADNTLLRNSIGLWIAKELGIKYVSDFRYVDLYINGEYRGLYLLCEKVEIGTNRIEITDLEDLIDDVLKEQNKEFLSEVVSEYQNNHKEVLLNNDDIVDLTGGYHLEVDNYEDELQFHTSLYDSRITIKSPENMADSIEDESFSYIKNYINTVEELLDGSNVSSTILSNYIDVESFALMWIHTEYMKNMDSVYTFHMWKESELDGDGLLHAGPVWDMDRSANRDLHRLDNNYESFQSIITGNPNTGEVKGFLWMDSLLHHDCIIDEIQSIVGNNSDIFKCCNGCNCDELMTVDEILNSDCGCLVNRTLDAFEEMIKKSANNDMIRWTGSNSYAGGSSIQERMFELAALKKFFCIRNKYLQSRVQSLSSL